MPEAWEREWEIIEEECRRTAVSPLKAWQKFRGTRTRELPGSPPRTLRKSDLNPLEPWRHLLDAAQGRQATERDEAKWAKDHLLVPWERIDPETVPSPGAVSLLEHGKQDRKHFMQSIYAPLLKHSTEQEGKDRFEDDGREVLHLIEKIAKQGDPLALDDEQEANRASCKSA